MQTRKSGMYVEHARNATFLLNRSYMDYHSDRFHDHSLMIFHNNKLYALLLPMRTEMFFYSHQGLTYAGLLTTGHASAENICPGFRCHQHIPEAGRFPQVHLQTDTLDLPATASRRRPLCSLQGMPGTKSAPETLRLSSTWYPLKWYNIRKSGARKA